MLLDILGLITRGVYSSVTESYRESYRDLSCVILKFLTRNKINENFTTSQMMDV